MVLSRFWLKKDRTKGGGWKTGVAGEKGVMVLRSLLRPFVSGQILWS